MAAGLGYKEFTTGDVLTAADANGYLASQVVMVFASAAARTSAIASPQEGMISFLKDTNSTEYYSGSAWTAIGGGSTAKSFALLNSGGTSLSGSTTTISSLSGYDQFLILVSSASSSSSNVDYTIRFNSDTGSNYSYYGAQGRATTNYESANIHTAMQGASQTSFLVSTGSNDATSASSVGMLVSGGNTAGVKVVESVGGATGGGGVNHYSRWFKGIWNNSSVISSISIISSAGTFDTGTIFIYGAV
jgi:hypothetical protein